MSRPALRLLVGLSVAGWAFGGGLFVYKYGSRVSDFAGWAAGVYALLATTTWWAARSDRLRREVLWAAWGIWSMGLALACYHIQPEVVQNNRWEVLRYYWDTTLQGRHSFLATHDLGEYIAAFPGLYVTLFPFYLVGAYALQAYVGALLLAWHSRFTPVVIVGLVFSLPVAYEVVARSTLLWNAAWVGVGVAWVFPRLVAEKASHYRLLVCGLVMGGLLLLRSLAGVLLAVLAAYVVAEWLRVGGAMAVLRRGTVLLLGIVLAAGVLLLPWYLADPEIFMRHNPLRLQRSFTNGWMVTVVLTLALCIGAYMGLHRGGVYRVLLLGGLLSWLTVVLYAIPILRIYGWREAVFGNRLDISYFVFGVPFVVLAWKGLDTKIRGKS